MKRLIPMYFVGSQSLQHLLFFYLTSAFTYFLTLFLNLIRFPSFVSLVDTALSLYFHSLDLSPCTVDLDDQTVMHFWVTNHRRLNKPNLIMLHGYGANARFQFFRQVPSLSRSFNLYIPDLLFFGKSYSNSPNRTDRFQARCVAEGMKRLGVERYAVYGVSYGGFVAYRMAEIHPKEVERVVLVSSGICYSDEEKEGHLEKIGKNPLKFLLPETPEDLRYLVKLSLYKYDILKWVPDYFLQEFINGMECRDEKLELAKHLLEKNSQSDHPVLTQESLLIWGNQDKFFPPNLAHQLQRHLGPRSKLEFIKDTGHAANLESPDELNDLIKSFIRGHSRSSGR